MTHYDTLGVSDNASSDEIKKAYRKLANQYHPDKGGNTDKFQQLQSAYEILSDQARRAQYDAERRGGGGFRFSVNGHDMNHGMPPEMEEMLRNFGFAFGSGFAGHGDPFSHFRQPRKNKDLQIEIVISLASTLEEQTKTINVKTTNGDTYPVEVKIPRGVTPSSTIKYSGLGDNFFATLPRGDLYIKIQIEANAEFGIDNLDLIKTIELDCVRAMIGDIVAVYGLDNKRFDLTVPAGTQPNTRFRLVGQGLYSMNQNIRGSLIVNVKINVPINLTAEQQQTLRELFLNQ
jgi:DnaJ-class molecular chaperone